jgi:hypothetical protein
MDADENISYWVPLLTGNLFSIILLFKCVNKL